MVSFAGIYSSIHTYSKVKHHWSLIVFKVEPGVMHFDTIFRCTHKLL